MTLRCSHVNASKFWTPPAGVTCTAMCVEPRLHVSGPSRNTKKIYPGGAVSGVLRPSLQISTSLVGRRHCQFPHVSPGVPSEAEILSTCSLVLRLRKGDVSLYDTAAAIALADESSRRDVFPSTGIALWTSWHRSMLLGVKFKADMHHSHWSWC
jgi:hypothetical protein